MASAEMASGMGKKTQLSACHGHYSSTMLELIPAAVAAPGTGWVPAQGCISRPAPAFGHQPVAPTTSSEEEFS